MSPASLCSGIALWVALVAPAGGAEPAVATTPAISPSQSAERRAGRSPVDDALDRISLDSTAITGNRELPKVMSIVPWKAAEPPDGPDRPMGSLIEEMLAPVDRDEFRREITYYHGLTSQSTGDAQAAEQSTASGTHERQRSTSSSPSGAPSQ